MRLGLAYGGRRPYEADGRAAPAHVALLQLLNALGTSLMVCDATGRELERTPRLTELIVADPDREWILGHMRALGRSLGAGCVSYPSDGASAVDTLDVGTPVACYRLRGTWVFAGLLSRDDVRLVSLERLTPELPSAERLVERHGLTRRQAEVATLLAQGMSNREIAGQLSLSCFTVRRHTECVFTKLRVHSRKALALLLVRRDAAAAGRRPPNRLPMPSARRSPTGMGQSSDTAGMFAV